MPHLTFTDKQVEKLFTKEEAEMMSHKEPIRTFATGATRDADDYKLDWEGFLSPLAMERYAEYMHAHRKQSDGKMRDSDNWQKGIPLAAYMKSLWRHAIDVWFLHRGHAVKDRKDGHGVSREEALCGVIFNAFGYLHEVMKERPYLKPEDANVELCDGMCVPCAGPVTCDKREYIP